MGKLILPQEALDRQICTECLNYLSVGPVMVSREGKIICGRCSESVDSEFQQSLYNLIAKNLVFKCINHYAGCRKLLRFNEALKHEEQCEKNCLVCPFCNYEGNGCQLIRHFDNKHTYSVVGDNFKVIDKFLRNLLFVKNGCIFCATIFVGSVEVYMYNLLVVSSDNAGPFSEFKLKFFDLETNVETSPISVYLEREHFPSNSDLNNAVDIKANYPYGFIFARAMLKDCFPSGSCSCKIELMDEHVVAPEDGYFAKIIEEIDGNIAETRLAESKREVDFYIDYILNMPTPDLTKFISSKLQAAQRCFNCKKYIFSSAYFCPKYHMACKKCTAEMCYYCKAFFPWNCKSRLHNISLQCEWTGCTVHTNIFEFMLHKQNCNFRRYECPDKNCNFVGQLVSLKNHWHLNPLVESDNIHVDTSTRGHYWLNTVIKDFFYVTSNRISDCKFLVCINDVNTILFEKFLVSKEASRWHYVKFNSFCGEKSSKGVQYLYVNSDHGYLRLD